MFSQVVNALADHRRYDFTVVVIFYAESETKHRFRS